MSPRAPQADSERVAASKIEGKAAVNPAVEELTGYVYFLLNTYGAWSEEGTYTFPNGDTWHKGEEKKD